MLEIDFAEHPGYRIDGKECTFHYYADDRSPVFKTVKDGLPVPISCERFMSEYGTGLIVRLVSGSSRAAPPWSDDDAGRRKARKRLFWLRAWDRKQPGTGTKSLAKFIKDCEPEAISKGVELTSPGTLRRDLKKRGMVGQRPMSLMIDLSPSSRSSQFDTDVEAAIADAIEGYYVPRGPSKEDAWVHFNAALRARLGLDPSDKLPVDRRFPCKETLRLRIEKAATFDNIVKRHGLIVAKARFRGVSKGLSATAPLECVVIDGTPIDTWIVVEEGSMVPLGRPYLTVAVDVRTRMVLGWHLGFSGESLSGIMSCILDVLRPKHDLRDRYPEVQNAHDGWGRPEKILVDNAFRQTGVSYQDAMEGLGIDLDWAPIRTPEAKHVVERLFQTLNTKLFHKAPGAVPFKPDMMKKMDIDPTATNVLTLSDVRRLLHVVMVDDYHHAVHQTLGMQPARAWKEGIAEHGREIVADLAEAARVLASYGEGTLTREGVRFKNHRFHDQVLTTVLLRQLLPGQKPTSQRRGKLSSGKVVVKFKWDPEDASKIEVWNHAADPARYETLPNVDFRYADGISFATADLVRSYARSENLAFQSDEERLSVLEKIRRMLEEATPHLEGKRRIAAEKVRSRSDALIAHVLEAQAATGLPGDPAVDVVVGLAEASRTDAGYAPPGRRRGGRKATAKSVETRRRGPDPVVEAAETILDGNKPKQKRIAPLPVVPQVADVVEPLAEAGLTTDDLLARFDWRKRDE